MKGNLNLYITRTITDTKTGKVIKRYRKRQAKSFVKAFMQLLEIHMAHAWSESSGAVTIKDVGGDEQSMTVSDTSSDQFFACEAPANQSYYGIQIGTGITAPAIADFTLETQIAHGAVATQMQYGTCSVQSAGIVGATMEMTITRAFVNASGGLITVKEVGLVCTSDEVTFDFLLIHDAVDDAVADGQTYTITYTLITTV